MNRTLSTASCLLAAAFWCSLSAAAQLDELSANDKDFIEFAGEVNLLEVRIAQMAEFQASSPKVKQFAELLEREHAADLKKLAAIAQKAGGVAPNTLDDVHMEPVRHLNRSKGRPFDHEFLKTVVNQHESALVSFKREADHGFDPALQAYAKATLPQMEAHLREAKQLATSAQ